MNLKLSVQAAQQDGVVARRQVLDAGYSDDDIRNHVRRMRWVTVRRGAYAEHAVWQSMDEHARHRARLRAASFRIQGAFAASHTSAVVAHDLPTWETDLSTVHLTRPHSASARREADIWHHVAWLPDDQVAERAGIPSTSGTRTVIDFARIAEFEPALIVADAALRAGLSTKDDLLELLNVVRDWPGARNAGQVVEFADGRSESPGESRARIAMDVAGLPRPELQVVLASGDRVDFLFVEHRTVVEFDGKQKYDRLLRPGEDPRDVVWREKRREDRIRQLGFVVVRLVWADLYRPEVVGRRIREAFEVAARLR